MTLSPALPYSSSDTQSWTCGVSQLDSNEVHLLYQNTCCFCCCTASLGGGGGLNGKKTDSTNTHTHTLSRQLRVRLTLNSTNLLFTAPPPPAPPSTTPPPPPRALHSFSHTPLSKIQLAPAADWLRRFKTSGARGRGN